MWGREFKGQTMKCRTNNATLGMEGRGRGDSAQFWDYGSGRHMTATPFYTTSGCGTRVYIVWAEGWEVCGE